MLDDKKEKDFLIAYEKYADDIYRHCYFRVYSKELAEDLAQETFIKTWKYISEGREIKNIRAFLYKVAVNLVIDNSRKKKIIYLDDLKGKEAEGIVRHNILEEEKGILSRFEGQEIIKILDNLSDSQKQVIIMRYIDDLLPMEIADILEKSPNAVSVMINQGIKELREIISQKYHYYEQ